MHTIYKAYHFVSNCFKLGKVPGELRSTNMQKPLKIGGHIFGGTVHYIVICSLSRSTIFFHIISKKGTTFAEKKVIEHKMCFDFLYNFHLKHFSF